MCSRLMKVTDGEEGSGTGASDLPNAESETVIAEAIAVESNRSRIEGRPTPFPPDTPLLDVPQEQTEGDAVASRIVPDDRVQMHQYLPSTASASQVVAPATANIEQEPPPAVLQGGGFFNHSLHPHGSNFEIIGYPACIQPENSGMNAGIDGMATPDSDRAQMAYGGINPALASPMNNIHDSDFASMMQSSRIFDPQPTPMTTFFPPYDYDFQSTLSYYLPVDLPHPSPAPGNQPDRLFEPPE